MSPSNRPHALAIAELAHGLGLEQMRQKSHLFALLEDEAILFLLENAAHMRLEQGEELYGIGDQSESFYLLLDGLAAIYGSADDDEALDCMTPGAFFGELSCILNEARSSKIVARSQAELLCFAGSSVQKVLAERPVVRECLVNMGLERTEQSMLAAIEGNEFADMPATVAEMPNSDLPGKPPKS